MSLQGQEREQQVIDGLLAGARAGRSGVVVVRGESGIGKTALLGYAAGTADGMLVLAMVLRPRRRAHVQGHGSGEIRKPQPPAEVPSKAGASQSI